MKSILIVFLFGCCMLTAQQNTKRSEVFKITKELVQLYEARKYDKIDSLNQRREKLFSEATKQGYGKEGLELVTEMDYNIARFKMSASSDNPILQRLIGMRDSIARQRE